MANNDQLFELMSKVYGEMQNEFSSIRNEMQEGFKEVKEDIKEIKKRVILIEQDHGKKLEALFDGHTQLNSQLDRIENEVSKHEEVILRRIR